VSIFVMMYIIATLASLLSAIALIVAVSRRRFAAMVTREVTELFSDAPPALGPEHLASRRDSLPDPVRRYLDYAIHRNAPAIRTARLQHDGFLRTKPNQRWMPVRGEEYFTVAEPGFVWTASVRAAPLVWIEARDHLLSGHGNMLVKLNSTLTIADSSGIEIDQGARLRWLAEIVWFPYGFTGDKVRWEPIDDRSARATLLGDPPVSAVMEIDEEGRLVTVRADRYRDIGGGKAVLTPWIGRCTDYREFAGFRVPSSIEVSWLLQEGEFTCIRFRVTALEYNIAHRF
jgi:hypothetical protein